MAEEEHSKARSRSLTAGFENASESLSEINRIPIRITLNSHGDVEIDRIGGVLNHSDPEIVAVAQPIHAQSPGVILFATHYEHCMSMMRAVLQENARLRELTELEEDAVVEVGNIIINAYLIEQLKLTGDSVQCPMPVFERHHYAQIFDRFKGEFDAGTAAFCRMTISVAELSFPALLFWSYPAQQKG